MKRTVSWLVFAGLLLFAAIFVVHTSEALPEQVAAHFSGAGIPNGYMPHATYRIFMLAFCVGLPLGVVGILAAVFGNPNGQINIPNGDYWLAAERRAQTLSTLLTLSVWLGSILVGFFCFVHWQVLDANAVQPARLSNAMLGRGVGVFLACVAGWIAVLMLHFRRPA
jgi:uncharacterized membrane protein